MSVLYSDDFNRADSPTLGTDYGTNTSLFKIVSFEAKTSTGSDVLERNATVTWPLGHYSEVLFGPVSADGVGAGYGPACCIDTGGADTGIRCVGNGSGYEVARFNASAFTSLGSGSGTTFAIGDRLRLIYNLNGVSGAWALYKNFPSVAFASGTDGSPLSTGAAGLAYSSVATATNSINSWEAGDSNTGVGMNPLPRIRPSKGPSPQNVAWLNRPKQLSFDSAITIVLAPTEGQIVISGQIPALTFGKGPTEGSVVISGQTPAILKILVPTEGQVIISGNTPTLLKVLAPSEGQVIISGQTPSLLKILVPSEGQVIISGQVPTVVQSGTTVLNPTEGQIIISGNAPTMIMILVPTNGQVIISGNVPTVSQTGGGGSTVTVYGGIVMADGLTLHKTLVRPHIVLTPAGGGTFTVVKDSALTDFKSTDLDRETYIIDGELP